MRWISTGMQMCCDRIAASREQMLGELSRHLIMAQPLPVSGAGHGLLIAVLHPDQRLQSANLGCF